MEADDDGARGLRQQDVGVGDGADAPVHDLHLHLRCGELGERVGERFRRAALVRLDQDTERALFAGRRLRHEIFERDASARRTPALRLAIEALTALRDIACRGRVVDDKKLVAGHRHAFHTKHLCRNGRTGGLDDLSALVEQCAYAAGEQAANEVIADTQRTVAHKDGCDGPLARIELRLDDRAFGVTIRIRLEIENLGL